MKFSPQIPKAIISFLLVVILSVGTISIVANAQSKTPLLQQLFSVIGVTKDTNGLEDGLEVSGKLCLNNECVKKLSNTEETWKTSGNNIYYNKGAVGIGAIPTANFTVKSGGVTGTGTIDIEEISQPVTATSTNATYIKVTEHPNSGADLSSVAVGDIFRTFMGPTKRIIGTVTAINPLTVNLGNTNISPSNPDEDLPWEYDPAIIFNVQNKGTNILTIDNNSVHVLGDMKVNNTLKASKIRVDDIWINSLGGWASDLLSSDG